MHEHGSSLPADLLEQVRGRIRLLSMLILAAFAFDPIFYFAAWSVATLAGVPLTATWFARTGFMALNGGAVAASALLWGRSTGQGYGTRSGLASGGPSISRPGLN